MVRIVTLFLASPGDVAPERMHVADAVQRVNRDMAHERNVRFEVLDWKTHARPRVDEWGPQGPIDKDMPVGECDIVVGIFWNRFGTPIPEMGGHTGTEHEIRTAIAAWRKSGKPEVVVCFNDAPFKPRTVAESEQVTQVLRFRFSDELRCLELAYDGPNDFRDKIRDYLGQYLKAHHPVTPGHVTNGKVSLAIAGDPARYIKDLREETSHFDVQGLKFGDNRVYRFPIRRKILPDIEFQNARVARAGAPGKRQRLVPLQPGITSTRPRRRDKIGR